MGERARRRWYRRGIASVGVVAAMVAAVGCECDCDEEQPVATSAPCADAVVYPAGSDLMWMRRADTGSMTWNDAMAWADQLELCGFDDWRLPSGEDEAGEVCNSSGVPPGLNCTDTEFATLYFADDAVNALQPGPFIGVTMLYWTSTEFPEDASEAMTQDMLDGGQNPMEKTRSLSVWAVRTHD